MIKTSSFNPMKTRNDQKLEDNIYLTSQVPTKEGPENKNQIQKAILAMADRMFEKNLTVSTILMNYIEDKVIDGCEYQLIKRSRLFACLKKFKLIDNLFQELSLKVVLAPTIRDLVEVRKVIKMMSHSGIKEDFPPKKGRLNYEKLKGPSIRTFNKIIEYLKENNVTNISDILPQHCLKTVEIVAKNRTVKTQTISAKHLTSLLRGIEVIKPNEDLDQDFIDFIEISPEYDNIIIVNTLKRAIKDVSNCRYFQTFGTETRKGFFNPNKKSLVEQDPLLLKMMTKVKFSNINFTKGSEQDIKIRVSLMLSIFVD